MKKTIKITLFTVLSIALIFLLYLGLNYEPSYKKGLNFRYAIPEVSYSEYNNLLNEINSINGINKIYIEKSIGNLENEFTINITSLDDFNALNEMENNLISGKFPKSENEIIISDTLINNDEIKNHITNEGYLKINIGQLLCETKYNNLLSCSKDNLYNIEEKEYKIVGVYSSLPNKIITKLNVSNLSVEDKINVILDIEEEIDENILDNLYRKYTTLENTEPSKTNDYGHVYAVDGSIYEIKDYLLDNKVLFVFTLVIFYGSTLVFTFDIFKNRKMKIVKASMLVISCVLLVIFGYSIISTRNAYIKEINTNVQKTLTLLSEEDIKENINNIKNINLVKQDNKLIEITFDDYKGVINYYKFAKDKNIISFGEGLTVYENEFSLVKYLLLLNKFYVTYIVLFVTFILVIVNKFIQKREVNQ